MAGEAGDRAGNDAKWRDGTHETCVGTGSNAIWRIMTGEADGIADGTVE